MDKEEAEKKAKEANEKSARLFCPICNGPCMPSCVTYYKAVCVKDRNDDYTVRGGYCTAYLLVGGE